MEAPEFAFDKEGMNHTMKTKTKSTRDSKTASRPTLKARDLQPRKDVKGGACVKGEHLKDGVLTA